MKNYIVERQHKQYSNFMGRAIMNIIEQRMLKASCGAVSIAAIQFFLLNSYLYAYEQGQIIMVCTLYIEIGLLLYAISLLAKWSFLKIKEMGGYHEIKH
jgi:uncharacterized membrane protein